MMIELPTLAQAYRILLQEETHLQLSSSGKDLNESLACRAEKRKFERSGFKNGGADNYKSEKQFLYCEHCKINGHTKDKCWKIIGYPTNHKANTWKREQNRISNANSVSTLEERKGLINAQFTQVQYQQILDMLNKKEQKETTTHANTSQMTGTYYVSVLDLNSWVIDSGASDHMCHDLSKFKSCSLMKSNNHVVMEVR